MLRKEISKQIISLACDVIGVRKRSGFIGLGISDRKPDQPMGAKLTGHSLARRNKRQCSSGFCMVKTCL